MSLLSQRRRGFIERSLENLESPFLDEEILPIERQTEFDSAELVSTPRDVEESDTPFRYEDVDDSQKELDADVMEAGDEHTGEFSYGEEEAGEGDFDSDARKDPGEDWEAALPDDHEEYEGEPDFEEETNDLGPADTIDEAAAQTAFPQTVRERLEPLLTAKRTGAASKWNSARHPAKSGIDAAALRARFGQYLNLAGSASDATALVAGATVLRFDGVKPKKRYQLIHKRSTKSKRLLPAMPVEQMTEAGHGPRQASPGYTTLLSQVPRELPDQYKINRRVDVDLVAQSPALVDLEVEDPAV